MMGTTYNALVLTQAKTLQLESRSLLPLQEEQVRIKLIAAGICGTDMHYYSDFANGGYTLKTPVVLGHEACGEVVEVAKGVTHVAIGDKVVVNPADSCGYCNLCQKGYRNLCPDTKFPGSATSVPHIDGYFRAYF